MATMSTVIERVDRQKPNAWETRIKAEWLLDLDRRIRAEVFPRYRYTEDDAPPSGPESFPADEDIPLVASGAWEVLYVHHLAAMIDYHNLDEDSYNNNQMLFAEAYGAWCRDWHRTHTPKSGGQFEVM